MKRAHMKIRVNGSAVRALVMGCVLAVASTLLVDAALRAVSLAVLVSGARLLAPLLLGGSFRWIAWCCALPPLPLSDRRLELDSTCPR